MSRSAWTTLSIPGRADLRARRSGRRGRTARWTWEIDAEATGSRVDRGEDLAEGAAVLLGQDRLGLGEREGPDVVAERGELGGVGLGEEVGAGAEHLPELHERRPEVLADHPQPARPVLRRGVVAQGHPLDRPHDPLQVERRDDVLIAVAHQRRQDLAIAGQVAEMADGFAEHGFEGFP